MVRRRVYKQLVAAQEDDLGELGWRYVRDLAFNAGKEAALRCPSLSIGPSMRDPPYNANEIYWSWAASTGPAERDRPAFVMLGKGCDVPYCGWSR
jgi:hypothetical protein